MRIRAATIGYWAILLVALSSAFRLYAQSFAMHGGAEALSGELIGAMLTRTVWGWGWMLQAAAVVVAIAGFHFARRGRAGGWAIAVTGVLVLAATPALSGHAASVPRLTALAIIADTLHVIGAGGWLGSLLVVLIAGVPIALRSAHDRRGANVADLINAYSPTGLLFAGGMVITGVFAAWLHVGFTSALWESDYGRILLLKLGIFSLVAAAGVYNWRRVRPALGDEHGSGRIRRSAAAELVVGAIVLIVTAVLVATPPPMEVPARTAGAGRAIPSPIVGASLRPPAQ
jgi:putative copper export protein